MSNVELALKHGAVINQYGFDARAGIAFTAIAELDAYTAAVRADAITEHIAQPVQSTSTPCMECNGTGGRDSGGTLPWGDAIYLPCECGGLPVPAIESK